jgi:hypothetical protein
VLKDLKDHRHRHKLNQKEYGAYISTSFYGKFDSMCLGPQTGFQEARQLPVSQYTPTSSRTRATSTIPWSPTC